MRLEILNLIYKMKSAYFGMLSDALDIPLSDLRAVLDNLIHQGYLFPVASLDGPYRLTNRGREYRLELEKAANAKAEDETKQAQAEVQRAASEEKKLRNNLKVAVISSCLSVVGTLFLEHFDIIVELIKKFFVML